MSEAEPEGGPTMITHEPQPQRKYWLDALEEAEQRLRKGVHPVVAFTENQKRRASDWPTCACGTGDPRIPRNEEGAPEDFQLRKFGAGFFACVLDGRVNEARETMHMIDLREAEILAEMGQRGEL